MFLASDVIKRHFGAHTESQESSSLPVAKYFLGLCLAKRRLNPQAPDGVYKHPLVYCRMPFINTSPFPALHLSRNAAKVSGVIENK